MTRLVSTLFALALTACGSGTGLQGDYGGPDCLYERLTFRGGGKMTFSFMGMEMPGDYEVDGDRVFVRGGDGRAISFTRNGDALEFATPLGTMRCAKL